MEADLLLCAGVLQVLCNGFGKDDPISRRAACLELCDSEERYNAVIKRLASQSLLDIVYVPNRTTNHETLYPVLHYGTLRLVQLSSAENVLRANLAPLRRQ
jgi:hypothetical protein